MARTDGAVRGPNEPAHANYGAITPMGTSSSPNYIPDNTLLNTLRITSGLDRKVEASDITSTPAGTADWINLFKAKPVFRWNSDLRAVCPGG